MNLPKWLGIDSIWCSTLLVWLIIVLGTIMVLVMVECKGLDNVLGSDNTHVSLRINRLMANGNCFPFVCGK